VRPGAPRVVHHILVFSRDPNAATAPRTPVFTAQQVGLGPTAPRAVAPGRAAGAAGAGAIRPRTAAGDGNRGALIATMAPGTTAQVFQPGTAMLIKAGSVISFQVHYTANGATAHDQSSVGFVFAKEPPQQEIRAGQFVNALFSIPPGAPNHQVDSAIVFNEDARIWALFPHTHLRGKSWEYRLVYPDGQSKVVLSVPKYDFNWQTYYEFKTPLLAPKGSRLEATAHYDNSTANKANPDSTVAVRWGEQTWEEMQYSGIVYTVGHR
jgi:hypothetical protein